MSEAGDTEEEVIENESDFVIFSKISVDQDQLVNNKTMERIVNNDEDETNSTGEGSGVEYRHRLMLIPMNDDQDTENNENSSETFFITESECCLSSDHEDDNKQLVENDEEDEVTGKDEDDNRQPAENDEEDENVVAENVQEDVEDETHHEEDDNSKDEDQEAAESVVSAILNDVLFTVNNNMSEQLFDISNTVSNTDNDESEEVAIEPSEDQNFVDDNLEESLNDGNISNTTNTTTPTTSVTDLSEESNDNDMKNVTAAMSADEMSESTAADHCIISSCAELRMEADTTAAQSVCAEEKLFQTEQKLFASNRENYFEINTEDSAGYHHTREESPEEEYFQETIELQPDQKLFDSDRENYFETKELESDNDGADMASAHKLEELKHWLDSKEKEVNDILNDVEDDADDMLSDSPLEESKDLTQVQEDFNLQAEILKQLTESILASNSDNQRKKEENNTEEPILESSSLLITPLTVETKKKSEETVKPKKQVKSPLLRRKEIRACLQLHNDCENSDVLQEIISPAINFGAHEALIEDEAVIEDNKVMNSSDDTSSVDQSLVSHAAVDYLTIIHLNFLNNFHCFSP